jgi:hypothetical protein
MQQREGERKGVYAHVIALLLNLSSLSGPPCPQQVHQAVGASPRPVPSYTIYRHHPHHIRYTAIICTIYDIPPPSAPSSAVPHTRLKLSAIIYCAGAAGAVAGCCDESPAEPLAAVAGVALSTAGWEVKKWVVV